MFRITFIYLIIVSAVLLVTNVVFADEVTSIVGEDYRDSIIEEVRVEQPQRREPVIDNTVVSKPPVNNVTEGQAITDLMEFAKNNTSCLSANIPGRGPVSSARGAFYGLTVTMARSVCRNSNDPIKKGMMNGRNDTNDVLRYYGLDHSNEKSTMINLYGLLLAHIHQETSGRFWEGVDVTNRSSLTADTAEAGLCQTSNNINSTSSQFGKMGMRATLNEYTNNNNLCLKDIFSIGMSVRTGREIIGTGAGAEFQKLMRTCPAAALEHCAISVRHVRKHYGPLNRKVSKALPACQSTFEKVYEYTQKNKNSVCPQLGITNN